LSHVKIRDANQHERKLFQLDESTKEIALGHAMRTERKARNKKDVSINQLFEAIVSLANLVDLQEALDIVRDMDDKYTSLSGDIERLQAQLEQEAQTNQQLDADTNKQQDKLKKDTQRLNKQISELKEMQQSKQKRVCSIYAP
jgi:outer membrane protein TolC